MIKIEVSPGDFLDRLTILEIKQERIANLSKLAIVAKEIKSMHESGGLSAINKGHRRGILRQRLKLINGRIWDLENMIRKPQSDDSFIAISREIRESNDQRADLKRQINETLGSGLMEVKDFQ